MNFLSAIDPNVAALLIAAVTSVGGWLYHKARGDKQDSLWSTVGGVVDNAIHYAVVTAESHVDDIRAKVNFYVWPKLMLLKIPRNAATEAIVNQLVEVAIAEAIQAAKDHDKAIAVNVAAAQASVAETVKLAAQLPALVAAAPKLLDGMQVQIASTDAEYQALKAKALADEAASKLPAVASTATVIGVTK